VALCALTLPALFGCSAAEHANAALGEEDGGAHASPDGSTGIDAAPLADISVPTTRDAAEMQDGPADGAVTAPDAASDAAGDASIALGGTLPCHSLLCEDFESGQIDPNKWTVQTSGGHTVMVEQNRAAHGKYAAQFHGLAGITGYDFLIGKNLPALRTHLFGRAFIFIDPKLPTGHTGLMFAGGDGFPHWKYLEVGGVRGGYQLNFVALVPGGGEVPFRLTCPVNVNGCIPVVKMPVQTWTCMEWEFNDQPDQAVVEDDGTTIGSASPISFNGQTTGLVGGFTALGFGFYDWHPDPASFDLYYDDIAVDAQRIGCGQ
jgi:hypothetical protein